MEAANVAKTVANPKRNVVSRRNVQPIKPVFSENVGPVPATMTADEAAFAVEAPVKKVTAAQKVTVAAT